MSETAAVPERLRVLVAVLVVLAIPVGLYVIGRTITPDYTNGFLGRSYQDATSLKAWFATAVVILAAVQVVLALWMYRKLPWVGRPTKAVRRTHRIVGATAFVLTLPVMFHCITTYGIDLSTNRTALHSLAGCFFYGAFAAKMLILRSRRLPGWMLPVAGGTVATVLALLWYSSALWYFNDYGVPGLS